MDVYCLFACLNKHYLLYISNYEGLNHAPIGTQNPFPRSFSPYPFFFPPHPLILYYLIIIIEYKRAREG